MHPQHYNKICSVILENKLSQHTECNFSFFKKKCTIIFLGNSEERPLCTEIDHSLVT